MGRSGWERDKISLNGELELQEDHAKNCCQEKKKRQEFVWMKLIMQDMRELTNCLFATTEESYECVSDDGPNAGQSKFLCEMQENFTILNQGAALERPTFLIKLLRFWVPGLRHAAILDCREIYRIVWVLRKRFWTTTCSRRRTLCNLPQFKDFGIFSSGLGTVECAYSHHFQSWSGMLSFSDGIYSQVVWWIIRGFRFRNGMYKSKSQNSDQLQIVMVLFIGTLHETTDRWIISNWKPQRNFRMIRWWEIETSESPTKGKTDWRRGTKTLTEIRLSTGKLTGYKWNSMPIQIL